MAWVGFDKLDPLGRGETGGRAALPMWMAYMGEALKGTPVINRRQPEGLVTVRIDPQSGLLARSGQTDGIFESFRVDSVPTETAGGNGATGGGPVGADGGHGELF